MMEYKNACLMCGKELTSLEEKSEKVCKICKKLKPQSFACTLESVACNNCHDERAIDYIESFCLETDLDDPNKMAETIMKNELIKMHGSEHHFLVPAVLLTAFYKITDQQDLISSRLAEAKIRAKYIPFGFCGSHGTCGAAVGSGIFISVVTNATSLSAKEWQFSNLMTSKSLATIALSGGPRCCKRDSFLAIGQAVQFARQYLDISIPLRHQVKCSFASVSDECTRNNCTFCKDEDQVG